MASSVTQVGALLAAPAHRQQQHRAPRSQRVVAFVGGRPQQQRQQSRRAAASSSRLVVAAAAQEADTGVGKLISKVEIPAFIPRSDILDQLTRWALIEVQENGVANCSTPCKVTIYRRDDEQWGFIVSFLKDGESACDIRVAFDESITMKHEWVGRGADGFPVLEGNAEEIQGKFFEIRKTCDKEISEATRASIRDFCTMLVAAINRYYAFGSCFVDDAT